MKVHGAMADAVISEGTEALFTLLGDTNLEFVAEVDGRPSCGVFHSRHEGSAVAMAEGYARASGKVGVTSVTAGPGLANALVSLTSATRAGTPMVLLTGQHARDDLTNVQWIHHEALARLAGCEYRPVANPAFAAEALHSAFDQARRHSVPVVVDVPLDVQDQDAGWAPGPSPSTRFAGPYRIQPDPAAIDAAVRLIAPSERPIVISGAGAVGVHEDVAAFAGAIGALLATTLPARGLHSGDVFDIGVAGLFSDDLAAELFSRSDLVIALGASLNHFTNEGGYLFPEAKVIQVDLASPFLMGGGREADCFVQADVAAALRLLTAAVDGDGARGRRYRTAAVAADIAGRAVDDTVIPTDGDVDPRQLCALIDRLMPADSGVVIGSGHFWAFPIMHLRSRRLPQLFTYHFGAIGQGLPVAVGAAVAAGDRPTVLFEGDASMMMSVHELETIARYRPNLLVVVLNDGALGAEYHKLDARGRPPELAASGHSDLAAAARAFGCPAATVTTPEEMADVMTGFATDAGPFVADVRVSRNVRSLPYRRMHFGID